MVELPESVSIVPKKDPPFLKRLGGRGPERAERRNPAVRIAARQKVDAGVPLRRG